MARRFQFDEFTLDESRYSLQRGDRVLRLEKRPMDLLLLLVERRGELVTRDEIAERLWGKDVFLEVDHGINTAIRKVRQALRDDPDKPRFIETVVGKGYRFAAPVACKNGASSSASVAPPASMPAVCDPVVPIAASNRRSPRKWLVIGALVPFALLAAGGFWYRSRSTKSGVQPPIKSIAVLPLKNLSGDPSQEYLADGMTEELIGRLSGIHDLRVISRTSVMQLKDTKLAIPEIAKTLNVDAVVEGSVIRDGSRVRVHAQLIRAATDQHFWSEEYDRDLQNVLALQSDVAQAVAEKVEVTLTGKEHARLIAARPVAPEVYESYLKGSLAFTRLKENNRAEIETIIGYFEKALERDPTFAPAYVGLARAYYDLSRDVIGGSPEETLPKAISAARKALELDPDLAEAHVWLAAILMEQWQWAEAESEYKRALELNPNEPNAHNGLAWWLISQGRAEEAIARAERARELNPLAVPGTSIGGILFYARRYDDALQEARAALTIQPDGTYALWLLGMVLIAKHHPEQAIPVLEKLVSVTDRRSGGMGALVMAYAQVGRRNEALRLLAELKRRQPTSNVPAMALVNAYLGLGDYDQAFVWLEQAYKQHASWLQALKVHPFFDPVRGDPRFQDLLRRVGLAQ